jgi:hypothetical protein
MPSQQSSFRGIRTSVIPQVNIALIAVWSTGPSKVCPPLEIHDYSPPI